MRSLLLVLVPSIAAASPIPPAEITDVVIEALRDGKDGEVASLPALDPAAAAKALRIALAKASLRVLEDRAEPDGVVITVEGATKARAVIALGKAGGAITVVARPLHTRPPGPCVPIPSAAFDVDVHASAIGHDGDSHSGSQWWHFETARLLDVDGDAIRDAFVPIAPRSHCPEDVTYRVYAVRGSCGHLLGTVGPGRLAQRAAQTPLAATGYRPLALEQTTSKHGKRGIPEQITYTRTFELARGAYRQTRIDQAGGVCHHCATWHCTKR